MPCDPPEREKIAVLMPTSRPANIDQRAAGIARIDRGIGLDEELVVGDADLGAGERRDDAVGDGLPDAEGIADRQHDVADLQLVGVGQIERRELLLHALEPQDRQIAAGILEHDLGLEFPLVGERHLDLVGALDDVDIGHDQARRIHHHARSQRALHLLRLLAGHAEEAAEDRIVEQRIVVPHQLGGIDIDHRRLHPLHDRRIREHDLCRRGRHPPILGDGRKKNYPTGSQPIVPQAGPCGRIDTFPPLEEDVEI